MAASGRPLRVTEGYSLDAVAGSETWPNGHPKTMWLSTDDGRLTRQLVSVNDKGVPMASVLRNLGIAGIPESNPALATWRGRAKGKASAQPTAPPAGATVRLLTAPAPHTAVCSPVAQPVPAQAPQAETRRGAIGARELATAPVPQAVGAADGAPAAGSQVAMTDGPRAAGSTATTGSLTASGPRQTRQRLRRCLRQLQQQSRLMRRHSQYQ